MPIYEYKCRSCGEKFEKRLGFFQNQKSVTCPKCGTGEPERVVSRFLTDSPGGGACSSPTGRFR